MIRKAKVFVHGLEAGILEDHGEGDQHRYVFQYQDDYQADPVSLSMPVREEAFLFDQFPPFFDGLLPEGVMLDALLRSHKLDKNDYFAQLVVVGHDLVGAVTVEKHDT